MIKIAEVIRYLEMLAPPAYQEGYDNAGLLTGNASWEATGILLTLDVTEEVVEEAVRKKANLIVAHHPIVFKGLRRITGSTYVERVVLAAIQQRIAVYAIHTNLDNVAAGVNRMLATRLGLTDLRILAPKTQVLEKLTFFVPVAHTQSALEAVHQAGAGIIGNYSNCSFRTEGTGTFRPEEGAAPAIGRVDGLEEVRENRVEVMCPMYLRRQVLAALKKAHPYEEVAYYVQALENENQEVGAGMTGLLKAPLPVGAFLDLLKTNLQLPVIKYTRPVHGLVRKIALCGGSGSFLLKDAKKAGADVFITADFRYHDYFDAENQLMICDIGHYESEVYTKDLLFNYLSEKINNFALYLSEVNTNPVLYHV